MSKRPVTAGIVLLAFLGSLFVAVGPARPADAIGIRVKDGRLVESDGDDLILRGINHGYTWYQGQTGSFAGIKAAGANAIRISLGIGHRWPANSAADVANVIARCKQNRLICILDAHDTMGRGQEGAAATMTQAVNYWLSVSSALAGQENYVIVNIADEPYANDNFATWTRDTIAAIRRLRFAGLKHTLMVDAPDWGQDLSFTMRDNAATVLAADRSGNTVFDVHMYGVFNTDAKVRSYLASFSGRRLPLVVGEFSDNHPYGKPDDDAIMSYSRAYRIGYLGWSWSGNSEAGYLDMVNNFDAASRTSWGVRFIAGANGLSTTSRQASVYNPSRPKATRPKTWQWQWLWPSRHLNKREDRAR
jgi:mannan endo-1,4-beta-mannosidase